MPKLPHSLEQYRAILTEFQTHGYQVIPPAAGVAKDRKTLFLRHDVDYDLGLAERLAQTNHELGVTGCFFVHVRSPLYNAGCETTIRSFRRIRELGQVLGLHTLLPVGTPEFLDEDPSFLSRHVHAEFELLRAVSGVEIDPLMSWHNPSLVGPEHSHRISDELAGILNAYSLSREGVVYMSDSNHRTSIEGWFEAARGGPPHIQALFHPFIWVNGAQDMLETLARTWIDVVRRNESEFLTNHVYRAAFPEGLPDAALDRLVAPLYQPEQFKKAA